MDKETISQNVDNNIWDGYSDWWKRTFTNGNDLEYERVIIPLVLELVKGSGMVLDIGSGEGQISRALARGNPDLKVVGIDPSIKQLTNSLAQVAPGNGVTYLRSAAEELPFLDNSFDAAVCCLVIEHTTDQDLVLKEAARVVKEGGKFVLLINHPLFQCTGSGLVDDQILGEQYWRIGPYLTEDVAVEEVDEGVYLPFAHRPISRYINPMAERDFLLVKMIEPAPLEDMIDQSVAPLLEAAIPRLLAMVFEHRPRLSTKVRG